MYLEKSLEKKLNETLKEYALEVDINKSNKASKTKNEIYYPHNYKKNIDSKNGNYNRRQRLFNTDDVSLKGKEAKEFIKDFVDPDIFELKKKRWDNSIRPNFNVKQELKKTLFEVRHGFKDVNLVKLNPKKIELGIDTRDVAYYGWNLSNRFENEEKKSIELSK